MIKLKPQDLYLDLLKNTLSFTLWPEPPIPIETFNYLRNPLIKTIVSFTSKLLGYKQLQLVKQSGYTVEQREEGRIWPGYADTMIGQKRLDNLQFCLETVLRENVKGDLIETGVWRGGGVHSYACHTCCIWHRRSQSLRC